jgi:hypothetical protein
LNPFSFLRSGLIALACLAPQVSLAQSATDLFVQIWAEHLTICGEALADPDAPVDERTRPAWSSRSEYFASEDLSVVEVIHLSDEGFRRANIWSAGAERQRNLVCHVSNFQFGETSLFPDIAMAAVEVRTMAEATPEFAVSGGRVSLMPGSDESNMSESVQLVILGGFPEYPASSTKVLITEQGMAVELVAAWEMEE